MLPPGAFPSLADVQRALRNSGPCEKAGVGKHAVADLRAAVVQAAQHGLRQVRVVGEQGVPRRLGKQLADEVDGVQAALLRLHLQPWLEVGHDGEHDLRGCLVDLEDQVAAAAGELAVGARALEEAGQEELDDGLQGGLALAQEELRQTPGRSGPGCSPAAAAECRRPRPARRTAPPGRGPARWTCSRG